MAAAAAASTALREPFVVDGKTFSHVGTPDTDVAHVDTWLKEHNLPKLSTHLAVTQTIESPLFLVYKNTNRNVLCANMTPENEVRLQWLRDTHVKTHDDGEKEVTYEAAEPTSRDRTVGCRIDMADSNESRKTFTLGALPNHDLVAIKMPLRTPTGLDSGLEEWRCGATVGGVPYWIFYVYLVIKRSAVTAYMLVEDQDGNIFVVEGRSDVNISSTILEHFRK